MAPGAKCIRLNRTATLLTDYLEIPDLALHGVRVYLAHVPASIGLTHLPYVKEPRPMIAVGDRDPVILRDHVVRYRQDGLRVDAQPGHLRIIKVTSVINGVARAC